MCKKVLKKTKIKIKPPNATTAPTITIQEYSKTVKVLLEVMNALHKRSIPR